MNIASIDIGTNTCLLLIASIGDGGALVPLLDEQRLPRLGKGVDEHRMLAHDAMLRVVQVLQEYREIIDQYAPSAVSAAATSAVRDAGNRNVFIDLAKTEAGTQIDILSGQEEALWTYRGVVSDISVNGPVTVIDIGGGSTELTVGEGIQLSSSTSLDIGSVRITERFFHHDPPLQEEIDQARSFIEEQLRGYAPHITGSVIGVAGTAVALALLDLGMREFVAERVSGYTLEREKIGTLLSQLRRMPASEIRSLNPFLCGREDIITAGALVLDTILSSFERSFITVSERGLRHGLAIRAWSALS